MRPLRDAACSYAILGWAVMPLKPRTKVPAGALVPHGMDDATADLATVFGWWRHELNIGIVCEASGLVVIDHDPRNGEDALHDLERALGPLPETPRALTGGGGAHVLLRDPGGQFRREVAPGVDIKSSGYIVAPPSVHPSGRLYEWEIAPGEASIAEVPATWLERMQRPLTRLTSPREFNSESDDPLRRIAAETYISRIAGRSASGGWVQCPFHKNGQERTPSLKVDGPLWSCFACEPLPRQSVLGGNIFDFAGLYWGYAVPLRGIDFGECRDRLKELLG